MNHGRRRPRFFLISLLVFGGICSIFFLLSILAAPVTPVFAVTEGDFTAAQRSRFLLGGKLPVFLEPDEVSEPNCESTIIVTSTTDNGPGTLRQAVADLCGSGTILFDAALGGGTVLLSTGPITSEIPLSIDGGTDGITISGGDAQRIFQFSAAASLTALSLQNGNAGNENGGAILTSAPLTMINMSVMTNTAYHGGAVYATANVVVVDSSFSNNTANGPDESNTVRKGGGALYVTGDLHSTNSAYNDNLSAGDGGALSIRGHAQIEGGSLNNNASLNPSIGSGAAIAITGTLTLSGTDLLHNSGGQAGGAVIADGDVVIMHGRFQQNSSQFSSGGALYTYGDLTITGTQFISNTALTKRGALNVEGDASISGALFQGNQADGYAGAMEVGGTLFITDTQFIGNIANNDDGDDVGAGAVYVSGATVMINSLFQDNVIDASHDVGALYVDDDLTITNTHFIRNVAGDDNGALWATGDVFVYDALFEDNRADGDDYGAIEAGGDLTIDNSHFDGNQAADDRGTIAADGRITITRSLFENNSALNVAVLEANGYATISRSQFINNTAATDGGAVRLEAGGEIVNSLFADNSAGGGNGTAVYIDSTSPVYIDYSTFAGTSLISGSAIYVAAGTVEIENNIIASHTAGIHAVGVGAAEDANLFAGVTTARTGVNVGQHSLDDDLAAAGFVAPDSGDFHLTGASLALNEGTNETVLLDFDGEARPSGGGFDWGYDEYMEGIFLPIIFNRN